MIALPVFESSPNFECLTRVELAHQRAESPLVASSSSLMSDDDGFGVTKLFDLEQIGRPTAAIGCLGSAEHQTFAPFGQDGLQTLLEIRVSRADGLRMEYRPLALGQGLLCDL